MFGCYDADGSGLISQQEVFELSKKAPVDGPFEKDLVGLMRLAKKEYSLNDYIEHVKSEGECEVIARMQRKLKIDVNQLPTDEKILGTKGSMKRVVR